MKDIITVVTGGVYVCLGFSQSCKKYVDFQGHELQG